MPRSKIKNLKTLKPIINRLKEKGKRIVFTNGCFDILHLGHVEYLEKAKSKGDILIAAINSDDSVRRLKGRKRPIIKEEDRSRILAALESIDYVIIFGQDTPYGLIKELRPDVLIKGADWKKDNIVGLDLVKKYGGRVETVKLSPGRSTTGIIRKIIEAG